MEPFVCARCGKLREGDNVAARNASGDAEVVCIDCLSQDELSLLGNSMDEIKCISEGIFTLDDIARGDFHDPDVMRVALERRIANDPASSEWAVPILDRLNRENRGEGGSAFLS